MIESLLALERAGVFEPIDVELTRSLARISGERDGDVLLATALASRALRQGHVCFPLASQAARPLLDEQGTDSSVTAPLLESWCSALTRSPLVGDDSSSGRPLVLDAQTFAVTVPPQGRLALRLNGSGEIGNLADLLPLGEDRVSGRFALDAAVNGTVAAPAASGRLTVTNGRYENFATGAVLNDLRLDIAGDRDRLAIREFSARDSAAGSLAAQGGVTLGNKASLKMRFDTTYMQQAADGKL